MKKLLFSIILLSSTIGFSQTLNALDPTFGNGGITTLTGWGKSAGAIKVMNDGKILILVTIDNNIKFIRLMPDGSIDNTYNSEAVVISGITKNVDDMITQSDGKIVVEIQTGTTNFMVRFNIDGTIDSSFGNNGYVTNCFQSVIYYSSRLGYDSITGNIYIVGNTVVSGSPFNTYFSTIECYTSTGILNTTFNGSGFRTWTLATYQQKINNLKIDSVGKIILVGLKGYSSYHGNDSATDSWMLRLNTDGTMDNTFSDDGMFSLRTGTFYSENYDYSSSVYLKDDNSILVVGSAGTYIANHQFMVYEVTNSGVLASTSMPISFPHPATWENKGLELVKDSNGKYILGGSVQVGAIDPNFAILRIGVDYTVDNTFGISGWISAYNQNYNYVLNRLAVQADNKILVLGITKTVPSPTETPSIVIARYLDSSILDNEDIAKNNPIVVSPNPASSILNVSVNDIGFLNTAYQIVDVNGRIINNGILTTNISEINVGELSKGIYFIKFENQNLVQKFIKK